MRLNLPQPAAYQVTDAGITVCADILCQYSYTGERYYAHRC